MSGRLSRRAFIQGAALGVGAVAAGSRLLDMPYLMAQTPGKKLRLAMIGCGGRGISAHIPTLADENLVAVIDPDQSHMAAAIKKAKDTPGFDETKVKSYTDYRKFFDEMNKEVDAVFIATPNHHHALPSMIAMSHGIGVYVEKPMAFDIWEARTMKDMAHQYKVATQMGNQGHSEEGYRRLCEYIWAGTIGDVTEVYHWTNRANGGFGPRPAPIPVPAQLDWDKWIGPAPFVDYHLDSITVDKKGKKQMHPIHPHEWHGWYAYGNGSLGNMACHVMDGAVWAMELYKPTTIEVEDILGGSDERYPVGTRIRWDYAERTNVGPNKLTQPPVKVWWYDGKRPGATDTGTDLNEDSVSKAAANKPPIMLEWEKKQGQEFTTDSCTFYVGTKGVIYTGTYGGGMRIMDDAQMKATPVPPELIPRIKHQSHQTNFLAAVRGGPPAVANFDYSARLTETMLLGDLAIMAGKGNKIEWDGDKAANLPDLNVHLHRLPRAGWEYPV